MQLQNSGSLDDINSTLWPCFELPDLTYGAPKDVTPQQIVETCNEITESVFESRIRGNTMMDGMQCGFSQESLM